MPGSFWTTMPSVNGLGNSNRHRPPVANDFQGRAACPGRRSAQVSPSDAVDLIGRITGSGALR